MRPVGGVVTSKTPVKARHLATNPYVACSYWSPAQSIVYIDCIARWVEDSAKQLNRRRRKDSSALYSQLEADLLDRSRSDLATAPTKHPKAN